LLVMEAMKMENQVLSDRAGVVENIRVDAGRRGVAGRYAFWKLYRDEEEPLTLIQEYSW
jgi:hypothetical protein